MEKKIGQGVRYWHPPLDPGKRCHVRFSPHSSPPPTPHPHPQSNGANFFQGLFPKDLTKYRVGDPRASFIVGNPGSTSAKGSCFPPSHVHWSRKRCLPPPAPAHWIRFWFCADYGCDKQNKSSLSSELKISRRKSHTCTFPVADPGFSPGGGANSQSGCANLFFWSKTA